MIITNEYVEEELKIRSELYGEVVDCFTKSENPKPFTSLVEIIERLKLKPEKLEVMAYSIDVVYNYYENHLELLRKKAIEKIEVYAYGKKRKSLDYGKGILEFIPTKVYFETHFNLIYNQDKSVYMYFEPYHKDINDFNIDFTKSSKLLRKLYRPTMYKPNRQQLEEIKQNFAYAL